MLTQLLPPQDWIRCQKMGMCEDWLLIHASFSLIC
uniref:Uncharacterized protein n=1 Tax=Rhizophora mucronata TaxID=61149 RepID=A0A2P2PF32_RHIMU